jgi:cytochrome c-type biogenesis protein CcmE
MMKPRHKRLAIAGGVLVGRRRRPRGPGAQRLPEQPGVLLLAHAGRGQRGAQARTFRVGGLVEEGSVKRDGTAGAASSSPTPPRPCRSLQGILPDLFKEGKGVVAQGQLKDGVFVAREVLAKHDENYMPPEAAEP